MTAADVTVENSRTTGAIPVSRTAGPMADRPGLGQPPVRRCRPREEYWDVQAARWVTRSPVPAPRPG